jgi:hypothetical protein
MGCRCGEGLSRTSKQLYLESRHYYFRHAKFTFRDVNTCEKFLKAIGHNIEHLEALAVGFNTHSDTACSAMDSIFGLLRNGGRLFNLHLDMQTNQNLRYSPPPLYWPYIISPAESYDLQFRVARHPLAELKTLRTLTVIGHPYSDEWEEVLFKLISTIKQAAYEESEQHPQIFTNAIGEGCDWFYGITIDTFDEEQIRLRPAPLDPWWSL